MKVSGRFGSRASSWQVWEPITQAPSPKIERTSEETRKRAFLPSLLIPMKVAAGGLRAGSMVSSGRSRRTSILGFDFFAFCSVELGGRVTTRTSIEALAKRVCVLTDSLPEDDSSLPVEAPPVSGELVSSPPITVAFSGA